MTTPQNLRLQVRQILQAIWEDPQGRLRLRQDFYRKYGHTPLLHLAPNKEHDPDLIEFGFGRSEIDFIRWEMERKVLYLQGSLWWKGVQGDFFYWSELARLAFENTLVDIEWEHPVRCWLDYLKNPGAVTWYRAHNTSIIEGYRARVQEAKAEPETEQVFINVVLARLLFAQALVEDVTPFQELGKILADPRLPSVQALVRIPTFYPRSYPLTPEELAIVTGHGGISPAEIAVRILDQVLLAPHLTELYQAAAVWNGVPQLMKFQDAGKLTYPRRISSTLSPNKETPEPVVKKKIVILGGGIASLAAAWELTSYEGWENEYEITLYQTGWRCGGKAGGGRGVHGRVEELGLHLLLGFYDNAFPVFREAYAERTARNLWPTARYKTLEDALLPNWGALLVNYDKPTGVWKNWPMIFPPSPGYPGDGPPLSTWQLLKRGVAILLETVFGSPYGKVMGPPLKWLLGHFFPKDSAPLHTSEHQHREDLVGGTVDGVRDQFLELTDDIRSFLSEIEGRAANAVMGLEEVHRYLRSLLLWLARQIAVADRAALHLFWLVDFGVAMIVGIVKDVWDPTTNKFCYRRINPYDFRAWLKSHGATDDTLFSPIVTFFYTGTFEALADGEGRGGALAAGTALQFAIPALGYKGSFMFQLRLGTADTLVMPLYQVLAARGVRFEFFSEVKNIPWTGETTMDRVELERQVDLIVSQYDPVVDVRGNPCWPSEPRYEQIDPAQAERLKKDKINLESPWSGWKGTSFVLERGKDFDLLILGIPSKAQATICKEIMEHREDWRAMVENIHTAQVMSAQLWFKPTLRELGYDAPSWGMKDGVTAPNVVTYQNPMFSWLDQSQIIENEAWPAGSAPKVLAMFTGVLPDLPGSPPEGASNYLQEQDARVQDMTWQWLMDNMGWFFPKASVPAYPKGIDLNLLYPTQAGTTGGMAKYEQQWFAAAVAPTNQYVLAVPNTEQYRLQPGGSGFKNLFLVGDWTDYGTNIGYMEGCVVSAKEAVECLREQVLDRFEHRTFWRDRESDWVRHGCRE